jgi:hypothetical protein
MAGIEALFVIILLSTLLGILATQLGVDSSASSSDPRRPSEPIGLS